MNTIAATEKKGRVTPEDYISAVKACPRAAWVDKFRYSDGKLLSRGYATRRDGDKIQVVPDSVLSSKSSVHSYARASTPDRLWAWESNGYNPVFVENVFFDEIPPQRQLHDYYVRKHGKLRGLNRLFPRRIQNLAAIEWVEEQLQEQRADPHRESQLAQLQNNFQRASDQMAAEKQAVLNKREYAARPQPVNYCLTHDEVYMSVGIDHHRVDDALQYKKGRRWFGILGGWTFFLAIWLVVYSVAFAAVSANIEAVRHFFGLSSAPHGLAVGGATLLGLGVTLFVFVILHCWLLEAITNYKQKHPSPSVSAYQRALELHKLYKAADQEAEQALLRRKRSYWESLNGYEFEIATAEVLKRHQFNPKLTGGSADGGVDIEVVRGGRKGVVQCKAHAGCIGPHIVRDLYGVIHHSGAHFGAIVSRGGFTKGAIDFARDKPILFLDISDLIAMQEGKDVLAEAFVGNTT